MSPGRPGRALFFAAALSLFTSGCARAPEHTAPVDAGVAPPLPSAPSTPDRPTETPPSPDGGGGPVDPDPIPEAERRAIPGWIAFTSERDENREAYLIRPSGEEERRLTQTPEDDYLAAPAPDGSALLVIRAEDNARSQLHFEQVQVLPLSSGPAQGIGPRGGRDRNPSFSPDGKFIVFESDAESFSEIYRVGRDNSGLLRLTRNAEGNFDPALSPDGTLVAFVSSRDGDPEIYRMRADGTGQTRLTAFPSEDWGPRWSPDGKRLAFLSDRGGRARIYIMDAGGTHLRTLAGALPEAQGRSHPSRLDAGGKAPAPGPSASSGRPSSSSEEESAPTWSPDGTRIAYVTRSAGAKARICVADLAAKSSRALTDDAHEAEEPTWSPDGRYLAFTSDRAGDTDLYLMRADGSGQTRLTRAKGADWLPRWVPPERQATKKER